jgi:hypothetical protein
MVPKTTTDSSQLLNGQGTSENTTLRLDRALTIVRQNNPELAGLLDAWPTLPEALKAGIMAMIDSTRRHEK